MNNDRHSRSETWMWTGTLCVSPQSATLPRTVELSGVMRRHGCMGGVSATCTLLTTHSSLFTVHYSSLFTIHFSSLFTTHCTLPLANQSPSKHSSLAESTSTRIPSLAAHCTRAFQIQNQIQFFQIQILNTSGGFGSSRSTYRIEVLLGSTCL